MSAATNTTIPPGWIGGFAESNPKFAYPNPNLTSIPFMHNDQNISLLRRQQNVRWPEFSWISGVSNPNKKAPKSPNKDQTRCYQMFSPFISRLGYDDTGRVFSIICPQQGVWLGDEICLNVEVTVNNVRGWVNENKDKDKRQMAADMLILPKIWLSPSQKEGSTIKAIWPYLEMAMPHLPLCKKRAIRINNCEVGHPHHPYFHIRKGETTRFKSPEFARHPKEAYMVSNLEVEILDPLKINIPLVDEFNQLLMDAFNLGAGNMLSKGSVLNWNVWFEQPALVNQHEWIAHAKKWRESIDAHHGPPYTEKADKYGVLHSSPVRYYDGTQFISNPTKVENKIKEIYAWLKKHIHLPLEI